MLTVLSNKQIDEQRQQDQQRSSDLQKASQPTESPFTAALAAKIRSCWENAKQAKIEIETLMLKAMRQRASQYEPHKLQAMKQLFGVDYDPFYAPLTDAKCRTVEAWIKDVIFPPDDVPFNIQPTPVPDVPDIIDQEIEDKFMEGLIQMATQQALASGTMDFTATEQIIQELMPQLKEDVKQEVVAYAKEAAEQMKLKINDQLIEGGWYKALKTAVPDIVTLCGGIVKGPVFTQQKVRRVNIDQATGKYKGLVSTEIIPTYSRVSPFDFFPSPSSNGINDGYTIEKLSLTRKQLTGFIGLPGYSEPNIRAVLGLYQTGGLREWTMVDSERTRLEQRSTLALNYYEKIDCLEFWGSIQGRMLKDWDTTNKAFKGLDDDLEYDIAAWIIGPYVIKAMLNPDPMGRKPYSMTGFEKISGSIWFKGVPQIIEHLQNGCNAVCRAIIHNVGLGSGPQIERNIDRIAPGESKQIYPYKVWDVTTSQMNEAPAVRFTRVAMVINDLIPAYKFFSTIADEVTVPAYAHGDTQVGGAGNTASGLSMLMAGSNRNMKDVIANVDTDIIEDTVQRQFDYNLEYGDDDTIIGDQKIVARGTAALIAKEQQTSRRTDFLATSNNPIDNQIMGLEGRAKLLKEVAKSLNIDISKEIDQQLKIEDTPPGAIPAFPGVTTITNATAAPGLPGAMPPDTGGQPGQVTPGAPAPKQATLPDGSPAGGPDRVVSQSAAGAAPRKNKALAA